MATAVPMYRSAVTPDGYTVDANGAMDSKWRGCYIRMIDLLKGGRGGSRISGSAYIYEKKYCYYFKRLDAYRVYSRKRGFFCQMRKQQR